MANYLTYEKGYYWVKFYNHNDILMMYFNGTGFESFKSDKFIHDEIESYVKVEKPLLLVSNMACTSCGTHLTDGGFGRTICPNLECDE